MKQSSTFQEFHTKLWEK